jgi:hypothetical protein
MKLQRTHRLFDDGLRVRYSAAHLLVAGGLTLVCLASFTNYAYAVTPTTKGTSSLTIPDPVSHIRAAGKDRITYHVANRTKLEAVVVDLASQKVLWRAPELVNRIPGVELGPPAYFTATDSIITVEPNKEPRRGLERRRLMAVVSRGARDGKVQWRQPTELLLDFPFICGKFVCGEVDGRSGSSGIIQFDPRSGKQVRNSAGFERLVANGEDALGSSDGDMLTVDTETGTGRIAATSGFRQSVVWDKPIAELFRTSKVSPDNGWAGTKTKDNGWLLWLGSPTSDTATVQPIGRVAGFGPKGEPRWSQAWNPCISFLSGKSLVKCDGTAEKVGDKGSRKVTNVSLVDTLSGREKSPYKLSVPFDDFASTRRVLRIDRNQWVLLDGDRLTKIDLDSESIVPFVGNPVGWCASEYGSVELYTLNYDGVTANVKPPYLQPCNLQGNLDPKTVLASIKDKTLKTGIALKTDKFVVWVSNGSIVFQPSGN